MSYSIEECGEGFVEAFQRDLKTEDDVENCLLDLFNQAQYADEAVLDGRIGIRSVGNIKDSGYLSRDAGVVIELADGTDIIITVQVQ
jgi:hypothetical protein